MGSNLVSERSPQHCVSLEHDLETRGWLQTAISRKIAVLHIVGEDMDTQEDQFTEVALRETAYEEPSLVHCNGWGLLVHWSERFPENERVFIVSGRNPMSKTPQSMIRCAGRLVEEVNTWIEARFNAHERLLCVVIEKRNCMVVLTLSQWEQIMITWAVSVDRIDTIGIEGTNPPIEHLGIKGKTPVHKHVPIVVVRMRKISKPDDMDMDADAIVCVREAMRIKYRNIYFHKMKRKHK